MDHSVRRAKQRKFNRKFKIDRIKLKIIDIMLHGEIVVVSYMGGDTFTMHRMPKRPSNMFGDLDNQDKIFMWSSPYWPTTIPKTGFPSLTSITLTEAMELVEFYWENRTHMRPK